MKITRISKVALLAMSVVVVASCGSHHKTVNETSGVSVDTLERQAFLQKVNDNSQYTRFITSKVKFGLEVGTRQMTLTGYLKMKRDDVIRLQLMAFGFVEAGRLEFTKDYMLVMDRINKLYFKVPYEQVTFLRNRNIDFNVMQGLFWAELFQPNRTTLTAEDKAKFAMNTDSEDVLISYEDGKIDYSWLAEQGKGTIKMANILYKDRLNGNTQLNWDYTNFKLMETTNKQFPNDMNVILTTPKKEVKLGIKLNYIDHETEWETRTEISNKYREVNIDDILQRFMAL